jgi:LPXTG-motif cell wall-anchored protein
MDITVTDLDTDTVVWSKAWLTDCQMPATTTTVTKVQNPPTTTPVTPVANTQVLGTQVTTPAAPALARTGSQSTTTAAIGLTLLALGGGLVTLGRRRKTIEA